MAINNGKPQQQEAPDKLAQEFALRCADLFNVEPEQLNNALAESSDNQQVHQFAAQLSQQLSIALVAAQLGNKANAGDAEQLEEARGELAALKERYAKQNRQLLEAQQENAQYADEHVQLKQKQHELAALKHRLTELESDHFNSQGEREELLGAVATLREQKAAFEKDNQTLI